MSSRSCLKPVFKRSENKIKTFLRDLFLFMKEYCLFQWTGTADLQRMLGKGMVHKEIERSYSKSNNMLINIIFDILKFQMAALL